MIAFQNSNVAPTALSFVASASSSTSAIILPASAAAGDIAALFDGAVGTTIPIDVIPSGWGPITGANGSGNSTRFRITDKVLIGGEAGSRVVGMNGANSNDKIVLVFRPTGVISNTTSSTWNAVTTLSNPPPQFVNASGQATPLIVLGASFAWDGIGAFNGSTVPFFSGTAASPSGVLLAGYTIYNSAPQNTTADMDDTGIQSMSSGWINVS